MVAIRAFLVGNEALRLQSASDQDLVVLVQEDLKRLTGIAATPRATRVDRWPNAMPQYVVGHEQRVREIRQSIAQLPSLHVIGNAYDGVGIPDCVRLARAAAEQIAADIIKSS
jgi:oxygen-dependent protoporphyrinogen oxidase